MIKQKIKRKTGNFELFNKGNLSTNNENLD